MAGMAGSKAVKRFEAIAALARDGMDASERRLLRAQAMEATGLSARTLRRYEQRYKAHGLEGLASPERKDKGIAREIPEAVVDEAVRLREELPSRSVRRIIEIMEGERTIKPGQIPRTSLNRHLIARGYGAAQLRAEGKAGLAGRRFERKSRNSLWQMDIKYGPKVDVNGEKHKTYLLAMIDDCTRAVMHAEFYAGQKLPILEDCFRKALLRYGKPLDVYVDNGKIFVSKWFRAACARLGIRHMAARPYSPESKGKIEKFNQLIDQFLAEFSLEREQTLESLNRKFAVWLDESYTHKPHSALERIATDKNTGEIVSREQRTPYQAYVEDPARVRYVTGIECRDAFLWEQTRTADKAGCVKHMGIVFDVGVALARKKVEIRYDPFDITVVEVWHGGKFQRKAEQMSPPEFTPRRAQVDAGASKATHSRLLKVYEERNAGREKARNGALSFRGGKGGGAND